MEKQITVKDALIEMEERQRYLRLMLKPAPELTDWEVDFLLAYEAKHGKDGGVK